MNWISRTSPSAEFKNTLKKDQSAVQHLNSIRNTLFSTITSTPQHLLDSVTDALIMSDLENTAIQRGNHYTSTFYVLQTLIPQTWHYTFSVWQHKHKTLQHNYHVMYSNAQILCSPQIQATRQRTQSFFNWNAYAVRIICLTAFGFGLLWLSFEVRIEKKLN